MTTHIDHPDSHENGLADGCPRCEEHAQRPEDNLDAQNVRRLMSGDLITALDMVAYGHLKTIQTKGRWLEEVLQGSD